MPHHISFARLGWLIVPALVLCAACTVATPAGSAAQTSTPPSGGILHVALTTRGGHDVTVDIDDASGLLRDAGSGTPGDGASVDPYQVRVTNDDPSTLRLTWAGGPCDLKDTLVIDSGARRLLLVEPECPGDAVAFDRVLLLHLSSPIDAADVQAVLQDGLDSGG